MHDTHHHEEHTSSCRALLVNAGFAQSKLGVLRSLRCTAPLWSSTNPSTKLVLKLRKTSICAEFRIKSEPNRGILPGTSRTIRHKVLGLNTEEGELLWLTLFRSDSGAAERSH